MNQELLDRCKSILENLSERPIKPNQKYTHETILGIVQLSEKYTGWRELFHRQTLGFSKTEHYDCDVQCNQCDKIYSKPLTKTQFVSYIGDVTGNVKNEERKKAFMNVSTCEACKEKEEAEKKASRIQSSQDFAQSYQQKKDDNTRIIIDGFLVVDAKPTNGKTWKDAEKELIRRINNCDNELIAQDIEEMEYSEFLRTPYWKIISFLVKKKNGFKCAMCNSKENLHVHHKSYDLHGYEHMKDGFDMLTPVCADCHSKHHEIES